VRSANSSTDRSREEVQRERRLGHDHKTTVPAVRSAVGVALRKELWSFGENRIAVRFQYECHDRTGQCWRSYGNELWEFTHDGLIRRREASINDVAIAEGDRRIHGPRAARERGLLLPVR
jgi:nuclear transport factor 2 (NTF2) superfamily protein